MTDDAILLRRYAAEKSNEAFAELVRRHLPLVYSAAFRRLGGDAHRAEDIAQVVFCALARNAHRLTRHPTLAAWLYTATRNEVLNTQRGEKRRRAREMDAHLMQDTFEPEKPADWSQLRRVLDTAMDQLGERDREAVLLRFFQGRPFAEIGALIGLSEDAARKRVDRALDTLRDSLRPHGIASTSAALATLLAGQTISAAPASLATSVTAAALVATGSAAGVTAFFTLTKLQAAVAAAVVVAGGIGLAVQQKTISALGENHAGAQQQLATLAAKNAALARSRAETDAELAQLRQEIDALKATAGRAHLPGASARSVPPVAGAPGDSPAPTPDSAAVREAKAKMHRRYDPFLQQHGLTRAQAERFVELKMAIYQTQDDLQAAMREAGAQGGTAGVEAMRSKLVKPMWDEIRHLLGEEARRTATTK